MEAATKNKRGRPKKHPLAVEVFKDQETRTAQNMYYAALGAQVSGQGYKGSFFYTDKGNFRRQGIAEQIGRMYEAGLLDEDQAKTLFVSCRQDYQDGATVKDVEKSLRLLKAKLQ